MRIVQRKRHGVGVMTSAAVTLVDHAVACSRQRLASTLFIGIIVQLYAVHIQMRRSILVLHSQRIGQGHRVAALQQICPSGVDIQTVMHHKLTFSFNCFSLCTLGQVFKGTV